MCICVNLLKFPYRFLMEADTIYAYLGNPSHMKRSHIYEVLSSMHDNFIKKIPLFMNMYLISIQ